MLGGAGPVERMVMAMVVRVMAGGGGCYPELGDTTHTNTIMTQTQHDERIRMGAGRIEEIRIIERVYQFVYSIYVRTCPG